MENEDIKFNVELTKKKTFDLSLKQQHDEGQRPRRFGLKNT